MGIRHVYHINIQCKKVKVIVTLFSCSSDLPYILKTISWINVILGILVLCDTMIDIIINVGHLDLYFMVHWFWPYILNDVWTSLFEIMNQYDLTVDLKVNVGHCTYILWSSVFMLHLEDNLMYDYHSLGLCDLYFIALWFCLISSTISCLSVIFTYNDTVWPKLWPQSKYKSAWPIFPGLVILLNIF